MPLRKLEVVDLFCGAGGVSTAVLQAAQSLGVRVKLTAVNHWPTAINSHSLNHPGVFHILEPVENLWPVRVVPSRRLDLLCASCECTFHSIARGGGPCNEQSRAQPWQIHRWATDLDISNILMENVKEFLDWGPLYPCTCGAEKRAENKRSKMENSQGGRAHPPSSILHPQPIKHRTGSRCLRPIPAEKGEYFQAFVTALRGLGYTVEWKLQTCDHFGDATSRVRLLLLACKDRPIPWPARTHGTGFAHRTREAREIIDWSLQGTSIFEKRPCENTIERIIKGLQKFGGAAAEPFIVMLRGTSKRQLDNATSIHEPLDTITAGGRHHCLIQPFIIHCTHQGNDASRCHSTRKPLPTVTGAKRGEMALIEPFLIGQQSCAAPRSVKTPVPTIAGKGAIALVEPIIVQTDQTGSKGHCCQPITQPLKTIVGKQNMMLVEPFLVKFYGTGIAKSVRQPLDAITCKDRFLLVEPKGGRPGYRLDVHKRMLQPHELAAAHSFPAHYVFTGTKEDQTAQIGNSVPVLTARAHAHAILKQHLAPKDKSCKYNPHPSAPATTTPTKTAGRPATSTR